MIKIIGGFIFCALLVGTPDISAIAQTSGGVIKKKYFPDKHAEFPGGTSQFIKYLNENFKCTSGNEGQVFVSFVIDSTGSVKPGSVYFVKSRAVGIMSKECEKTLTEVLENSPKWVPGFNKKIKREVESNII